MRDILRHYQHEFSISRDVAPGDAERLFDAINAENDETVLAAFLRAWNAKGTTEDELFEFATIMRRRMKRIRTRHTNYVDMVGTGGSTAKTFNVSTAAAFVIAGAGVAVAKHGNRAATSSSGSADVLSRLGVEVDIDPEHAERHLDDHGLCFLFAPRFHALSPTLARARRTLGEPTIFNNLGPLCNPASAPHHVIGVANEKMFDTTARVLDRLGTGRSWIVRGENGLDEVSLHGRTQVAEINGRIERFDISAADLGMTISTDPVPKNCTVEESERLIRDVLAGKLEDHNGEKLVLINAAVAIYVTGACSDLRSALHRAKASIRTGAAEAKLEAMAAEKIK